MASRAVILDANILIRAVLGNRVRRILEKYADPISFLSLNRLIWKARDTWLYGDYAVEARKRLGSRDPSDWPILASALALGCPSWTEDTDFFGCGVATWTSDRVEIFLGN